MTKTINSYAIHTVEHIICGKLENSGASWILNHWWVAANSRFVYTCCSVMKFQPRQHWRQVRSPTAAAWKDHASFFHGYSWRTVPPAKLCSCIWPRSSLCRSHGALSCNFADQAFCVALSDHQIKVEILGTRLPDFTARLSSASQT